MLLSRKELVRYSLEATLIVLSVLLALYLDQVFENRREQREMRDLVSHVTDEMDSNLQIIEEWLPYHRSVVAEINRYLSSEALRGDLVANGRIDYMRLAERGILQDFYSVSAWQLAQQSPVTSRIDFEVSHAMSTAYQSQENVNRTLQRISDYFFSREIFDVAALEQSLIMLRNLMQELAGQEEVLRQHYLRAVEAAKSH